MISKFSRKLMIDPSMTDIEAKLSYNKAFMLFMDIASEHAEHLDIGTGMVERRKIIWLTVKTRIKFFRRPLQGEVVTMSTWADPHSEFRWNRNYDIVKDGEVLVAARTQWAVIDLRTGKPHCFDDIHPDGLDTSMPPAFEDDYSDIPDISQNPDAVWDYVVRPTDIDLFRHMNNTAYIRAAFDTIPNRELVQKEISSIDVVFLSACTEGDCLNIKMKQQDEARIFNVSCDGKPSFLMEIR